MPAPRPRTALFRDTLRKVKNKDGRCWLQSEVAAATSISPAYVSRIFLGKTACSQEHAIAFARFFYPDHEAQQKSFLRAVEESNHGLLLPQPPSLKVQMLTYGHLKDEELKQPVTASHLSGPGGFLIDCMDRLVQFTGQGELKSHVERVGLFDLFSGKNTGDVVLSHLAALNMINSAYFICTPVSIGIGGLMYLGNLPHDDRKHDDRKQAVQALRSSFSKAQSTPTGKFTPRYVYMEKEIGSYFVGTLPDGLRQKSKQKSPIVDLTVAQCCKALMSATDPRHSSTVPLLLADELTCYLTLQKLGNQAALLYGADAPLPRFYFGFSVARANRDLRKDLERTSELYLQSDAPYVITRYAEMYRELVDFAKRLKDFSGNTWLAMDPPVWAKRICGIEPNSTSSALISRAWRPIIDEVKKKIETEELDSGSKDF